MSEISVYVCDTAQQAQEAKTFLTTRGYREADIAADQVDTFIYNAATFSTGTTTDNIAGKWIVRGRK